MRNKEKHFMVHLARDSFELSDASLARPMNGAIGCSRGIFGGGRRIFS